VECQSLAQCVCCGESLESVKLEMKGGPLHYYQIVYYQLHYYQIVYSVESLNSRSVTTHTFVTLSLLLSTFVVSLHTFVLLLDTFVRHF